MTDKKRRVAHARSAARLLACILGLIGSVAFGAAGSASDPATRGQHIYASHHSYFLGIPALLDEVAARAGITDQKIVGSDYIGGSKSLQHWVLPDDQNPAKAALKAGNVDALILTPVYLPDDGIEKFAEYGLQYNSKLRVTVMEFWLPYDVYNPTLYDANYKPVPGEPPLMPKPAKVDHNAATGEQLRKMHHYYFETMDALVTRLNRKFGKQVVYVVPIGQAVIALREKVIAGQAPGIPNQEALFIDELGHPKPPIQLLEAYEHFAVIYHKSPVGLPVPSVLAQDKDVPAQDDVALNTLLQQLAWDAVTHCPLSGVNP